jgi:hypothetical protein
MTDVSPALINIVFQRSPEEKDKFTLFGNADNVIGTIANYAQVISFVGIIPAGATIFSLLKELLGFSGPSDREILDSISEKVDKLIRFEHGFLQHLDMLDIDGIVGKATARLETLLAEGPDGPDVSRSETNQDSLVAANSLDNRDFWTRPFFEELVYPRGDLSGDNFTHVFWLDGAGPSRTPPVDPDSGIRASYSILA